MVGAGRLSAGSSPAAADAPPPEAPSGGEVATWDYAPGRPHYVGACLLAERSGRYYVEAGFHDRIRLLGDGPASEPLLGGGGVPMAERAYPHLTYDPRAAFVPVDLVAGVPRALVIAYDNPRGEGIYATNTPRQLTVYPERVFEALRGRHLLWAGALVGGLALLLLYHLGRMSRQAAPVDYAFAALLVAMITFLAVDHGVAEVLQPSRALPDYFIYPAGGLGLATLAAFARAAFREVDYWRTSDRALLIIALALAVSGVGPALAYALSEGPTALTAALPGFFRAATTTALLAFVAIVVRHARHRRGGPLGVIAFGLCALALTVVADVTQAVLEPHGDNVVVGAYLALIRPVFSYLISAGIVLMCACFAVAVAHLRRDREQARERAFHLRVAETEQRALRAQMNPHFIFNTLNSIKAFVIQNERRKAAAYLTKFAKLIRLVLDGSAEVLIPLSRELEMLGLYLELERERAGRTFEVVWDLGEDVDVYGVRVPPTLLQPFAENAVWHGVRHLRDRPGEIVVALRQNGRGAGGVVELRDNGVGRAASAAATERKAGGHVSRGLEITLERAHLVGELHGIRIDIATRDLVDDAGRVAGTAVALAIAPRGAGRPS